MHSGINANYGVIANVSTFATTVREELDIQGVKLLLVKCSYDAETPRPPLNVVRTFPEV
jgi:hypothetical protein